VVPREAAMTTPTDIEVRRRGRAGPTPEIEFPTGPVLADLSLLVAQGRKAIALGLTPADAARYVLTTSQPDEAAQARLMETGLAQLINTVLGHERQVASRPGIVRVRQPDVEVEPEIDPLTIEHMTADGKMRPFLAWTIVDWQAWEQVCQGQAQAWTRQQHGSREIAHLLHARNAETVGDLSDADLEQVRQIVREFRA
jgi:hypothetical protein